MIDLTCPITEVATLIPHSGEMVLLDAITEVDSEHLIAETRKALPPGQVINACGPASRLAWVIGLVRVV